MAEQYLTGTDAVLRELQYVQAAHNRDVFREFQAWHARLDGLLHDTQERFRELEWRSEGQQLSPAEQMEGFYGALDGLREDRVEVAQDYGLDQLHDRLDDMEQTRQ